MAKEKETVGEVQNVQEQPQSQPQQQPKDTRVIYAGPTISNEKFFLRKGQIFTEVPLYAPEELRKFFVPLSEYSPEKEKELEKEREKYLKSLKK
ncbi:hypothetical protein SAMN06269117_12516 [Balnearium lithotrophicum]|uniref:Uncharacterized protein n=1 Tax=Balnearium lithotrophicum TaxID=223788 RepID=A0A521DSK7_9BACT|nr:hypothetical protein [Balnearium lithotrophicum]SMO74733.1 hypothetical protein SAMN06269117_12516 [Balnearium lithotrophicum]